MKTTIGIIIILISTLGCNNSKHDNSEIKNSDSSLYEPNTELDEKKVNSFLYVPNEAIWEYQFDTVLKDFKPVQLRKFRKDTLTAQGIERIINKTWPKIQIKYLKTYKDTIFISISDSEVLTQQMGTSGADGFMISTTYSFTELPGIKYVSYDFEAGDHANPGVFNRNSWAQTAN